MRFVVREILSFIFILITSLAVIIGIVQFTDLQQGYSTMNGTVDKKELRISSPVYGVVEEMSLYEGQLVHKGQVLSIISPITDSENPLPTIDSDLYRIDDGKIFVMSPVEAIVADKLVATKSTVKALDYFISLQPFNETAIIVDLPNRTTLADYNSFYAVSSMDENLYALKSVGIVPNVQQGENTTSYFMVFEQEVDAKYFTDTSTINVKAKRIPSDTFASVKEFFAAAGSKLNVIPQAFSRQ